LTVTGIYTTTSGTATAGNDFVVTTGIFTIAAGSTGTTVSVVSIDDNIDENNEIYTMTLSNLTNGTAGTLGRNATINDDESPPALTVVTASNTEGNQITLTYSMNRASER
jgi:hypothetical protein